LVVPGPEGALYEYREVPPPAPKAGEVLVKVRATGTNRGERVAEPRGIRRARLPARAPPISLSS